MLTCGIPAPQENQMNKIILSGALLAALLGAGTVAAQSAECQQRLPDGRSVCDVPNPGGYASPHNRGTIMGGPGFAERQYRNESQIFPGAWLFGDDRQYRRERDRNDRDGDGIRNNRDKDRDGDGVRNNRDSHPDDARRR
jgi:hypothetical protein